MNTSLAFEPSLRAELEALGVTDDIIREVIIRGETERDSVSPNDAPTRGGMNAYFERVLAVRELLAPHGWTRDNSKNLCTVVSPCGRHAIAVVTGDRSTGRADAHPQPKYPRGNATAYAVNTAQLSLFDDVEQQPAEEKDRLLWFLLVHRAGGASEALAELSLPDAISEEGTVTKWTERNVLDPIDLAADVEIDLDDAVEETVQVEVVRKS